MQYVRGASDSLKCTGPQHLPPLGRKDRRPSVVTHPLQLSNGKNSKRHVLRDSSFPDPASVLADWPSTGPAVLPVPEWTAFSDIFVQAGQAAGIAFQWTEPEPVDPATPHEAGDAVKVDGLVVVGVAEDSLAARHGGVSPGMMLIEISGQTVTGMSQDEVTRVMRHAASQPRVLTLARVAPGLAPTSLSRAVDLSTDSSNATKARQVSAIHASDGTESSVPARCPASSGLAGVGGVKEVTPGSAPGSAPGFGPPSSSESSQASSSRPYSSSLSVDGNKDAGSSSVASTGSAVSSPFYTVSNDGQLSLGPSKSSSRYNSLPAPSPPQRVIALRFVGSRGNMTLFDRDHVLGLKTRDIEFVPPNNQTGEGRRGSLTLQTAAKHHRENSHRSLQDLTRDWINDPFSTPARRRRLINDVCKVIVWSYTHAAAWRVAELRREEKLATRVQAAFRTRSARRLFLEKLAGRRVKAASVLQLSWLSCTARRRARVLREERDHARRTEEAKSRRREADERRERRRREEEERRREIDRRERESRRRRERDLVVRVQRRFRARQEVCELLMKAPSSLSATYNSIFDAITALGPFQYLRWGVRASWVVLVALCSANLESIQSGLAFTSCRDLNPTS